ncbi:DUF4436 family protein [Streptomyces sp. A7024]|uniref:DUF4436 family protein n=1 Tax=Streptomyces coryli TaxID=1128680 RepID=A0A6G4U810_9ACTN|nr:DUF4436 family protein [Streptomyces coryli]NGN68324.1 DUF4436 family protein [Streptomyces coryli]
MPFPPARRLRPTQAAAAVRDLPWRHALGLLGLLAVVFAAGIGLYLNERDVRQRPVELGADTARDRVTINAAVHRADPGNRRVTVQLTADPHGRYAVDKGALARPIKLHTNATGAEEFTVPSESPGWVKELELVLEDGTISDYPFDRYDFTLALAATAKGKALPVELRFVDQNTNFEVTPKATDYGDEVVAVRSELKRSRSTFIMTWFMIATMWVIALAVSLACWLVVNQGRGLVWGALGWMAASLFALVGLRNAAPGSPPNGCLLDYAAFYWAEALIAISVITLVFHGIRAEHHRGGPIDPLLAWTPAGQQGTGQQDADPGPPAHPPRRRTVGPGSAARRRRGGGSKRRPGTR